MLKLKELYLCNALDKFKEMITHNECSKSDIAYFYNLSKYELTRRGTKVDKKEWFTKIEASQELSISTSTFDRLVIKGIIPRGKKITHQRSLMWKLDDIEQLKQMILLNANN